jgi:hypothetical protein
MVGLAGIGVDRSRWPSPFESGVGPHPPDAEPHRVPAEG